MTSQAQGDDFCLECHWKDFRIDEKDPVDSSESQPRAQWTCSDQEHHTSLVQCEEEDEACCDVDDCQDDCQFDCGSICDGFVDCDTSSVCSVAHCDDKHCEEDNCDDGHCESTDPICFDDHCCDFSNQECNFDSFFGLNTPMSLGAPGILPASTMDQHTFGEPGKTAEHTVPGVIDPCYQQDFLSSYQTHATQCDQNVTNHFECHDFQKDLHAMFPNQHFPQPTEVNPAEVFHMMGMCSDTSICHDQHVQHTAPINLQKPKIDTSPNAINRLHHDHDHHDHHNHHHAHTHGHFKNPNDLNLHLTRGPHRNHHRCRAHHHAHSHPYSPYSRQSRSSISSHLLSSPGETPPPLDGGVSSVLTTPDFSAEDNDLHICKWTTTLHGIQAPCGATFADSGALQEHLVSSHMSTVDGAKGNGYYCCWEGCHRPDEPFSQKSKLQGHFLTHSNCKKPTTVFPALLLWNPLTIHQIKTSSVLFVASHLLARRPWTAMSAATGATSRIGARTAGRLLPIAAS